MKKRILSLVMFLILILGLCPSVAMAAGNDKVKDCRNGVVRVFAETSEGRYDYIAFGSAFGIGTIGEATDTFVTNTHVVVDEKGKLMDKIMITTEDDAVKFYYDGRGEVESWDIDYDKMIECEVIYYDEDDGYPDVAIIRAERIVDNRVALPLMSDNSLEVTDEIFALGFPAAADTVQIDERGEQEARASVEEVNVTAGKVSKITDAAGFGNVKVIMHDTVINSGNSGGPLVNTDGVVVGINTYGFSETGGDSQSTTQFASIHMDEVIEILNAEGCAYQTQDDIAEEPPVPEETEEPPAEEEKPEDNKKNSENEKKSETDKTLILFLIIAGAAVVVAAAAVVVLIVWKKKAAETPVAAATKLIDNPRLQAMGGEFNGRRFAIERALRIGRDPDRNDLVFPATTQGISGAHCVLNYREGGLWLTDLGSTYGTYLANGRRLKANVPTQMKLGDRFWLGSEKEVFQIDGVAAKPAPRQDTNPAPAMMPSPVTKVYPAVPNRPIPVTPPMPEEHSQPAPVAPSRPMPEVPPQPAPEVPPQPVPVVPPQPEPVAPPQPEPVAPPQPVSVAPPQPIPVAPPRPIPVAPPRPIPVAPPQPISVAPPQPMPVAPPQPAPMVPQMPARCPFRLRGENGVYAGRTVSFEERVCMGRDPKKTDVTYPASTQGVSATHCMVVYNCGLLWLEDLGSTFGTYYAGKKLMAGEPVQLRVGDRFGLGSERETFIVVAEG